MTVIGRDDEPDGLDYMGTTWVERNEYDNLRGHRDRLRKERDAGRDQLAGAVAALREVRNEIEVALSSEPPVMTRRTLRSLAQSIDRLGRQSQ